MIELGIQGPLYPVSVIGSWKLSQYALGERQRDTWASTRKLTNTLKTPASSVAFRA